MNEQQTSENVVTAASAILRPVPQRLLIIGGGTTALVQLQRMLAAGASAGITVVSQDLHPAIKTLAAIHGLALQERVYTLADLEQADLVIIASDDPLQAGRINADIHRAGKQIIIAAKPGHLTSDARAFMQLSGSHQSSPISGQQSPLYSFPNNTVGKGTGKERSYTKLASRALLVFATMLIGHFLFSYLPYDAIRESLGQLYQSFDQTF